MQVITGTRGNSDLPVIDELEEIVWLVEREAPVYVRYSEGPDRDREAPSRDYETGLVLPGLCVTSVNPPDWWTLPVHEWVARRICKYVHLMQEIPQPRPWLLTGCEAGPGPEHEPLLTECRPLAWVGPVALADAMQIYQRRFTVARHADVVLAELTADQQAIARRIFLRLIQFGTGRADTRRQRTMAELGAAGDEPAAFDVTLEHLIRSRLVRRSTAVTTAEAVDGAGTSEERVDLEHEALIIGWPWLHDLVAQRGEAEQTRQRLEDKASEWVRLGRGRDGLLDEAELAEAERWLAGPDAAELGTSAALLALVAFEAMRQLRQGGSPGAGHLVHGPARHGRVREVVALIHALGTGLRRPS